MKNKKSCLECGKEFTPYRENHIFCSRECGHRYRSKFKEKKQTEYKPVKCKICEKEFVPVSGRQIYCCEKCAKEAVRRRHYKYLGEIRKKPQGKARVRGRIKSAPDSASERWERMTLTELSAEIARLFPGMSFGQVRLLKEQGKLPDDFGLGVICSEG